MKLSSSFAAVAVWLVAAGLVAAQTDPSPFFPPDVAAPKSISGGASAEEVSARLAELRRDAEAHPQDAIRLAKLGLALVWSGQSEEGLATLLRAGGMAPQEPEVMLMRAKGFSKAKQLAEAVELATRAGRSALSPPRLAVEALTLAGTSQLKLQRTREAEALLREALSKDPKYAPALFNLGLMLLDSDNTAEGWTMIERAALHAGDNAGLLRSLARTFEANGNVDRAFELWTRLHELLPSDPGVSFVYGSYAADRRMWSRAKSCFETVIAANAADAESHLRLAGVLIYLKSYDEAELHARAAEKLGHAKASEMLAQVGLGRSGKIPDLPDASPMSAQPTK
jgi:tetratricopeptide (TPR) repeat protein